MFLIWNAEASPSVRAAQDRLSSKVTSIGHSSSLVQIWLAGDADGTQIHWTPDDYASEQRMRVPEAGTLAHLEAAFARSERPRLNRWQGYHSTPRSETQAIDSSVFDPGLIVFEKHEGRMLGLESTLQLTGALRNAAMRALPQGESPEWLSGHAADGSPTTNPHVAFFRCHSSMRDLPMGMYSVWLWLIPRDGPPAEAKRLIGPLLFSASTGDARTIQLWRNDNLWEWRLRRETRDRPPTALRSATWTEASCI